MRVLCMSTAPEFLELCLTQNKSPYICLPSSKTYFGTKAEVDSKKVIRAVSRNTFVLVGDHLNKYGPQPGHSSSVEIAS